MAGGRAVVPGGADPAPSHDHRTVLTAHAVRAGGSLPGDVQEVVVPVGGAPGVAEFLRQRHSSPFVSRARRIASSEGSPPIVPSPGGGCKNPAGSAPAGGRKSSASHQRGTITIA